jgi:hypothetical protein
MHKKRTEYNSLCKSNEKRRKAVKKAEVLIEYGEDKKLIDAARLINPVLIERAENNLKNKLSRERLALNSFAIDARRNTLLTATINALLSGRTD